MWDLDFGDGEVGFRVQGRVRGLYTLAAPLSLFDPLSLSDPLSLADPCQEGRVHPKRRVLEGRGHPKLEGRGHPKRRPKQPERNPSKGLGRDLEIYSHQI